MTCSNSVPEISTVLPEQSPPKTKSKFSLWQLWNMNFGFLGIQFGWGLQMANMSAIFEHLGAQAHQLPILWIAAPLTGLVIQPIVGNLSDYTWGPLGRRRPYFLTGAILAAAALIFMPRVSELWMAAILLWVLDASANISMEPYRAFVGDLLPKEQRTQGFAAQSLMIGLGAVFASGMPWILNHFFQVGSGSNTHSIPRNIEISFYIGASLFLITILWTVFTTDERPPKDFQAFEEMQEKKGGIGGSFRQTFKVVQEIPPTMRRLAYVQLSTWLGIFCFFLYFPPAVAHNIFGAVDQTSELYNAGIEWSGLCFALFNVTCAGMSLAIPVLSKKLGQQTLHSFCLVIGGVSLLSTGAIQNQYWLLPTMIGFGISWASILSIPYSMLTSAIPVGQKGIYMGIFNISIVIPEILVSLCFGWIMKYWLHDNRITAVGIGGVFLLLAAALMAQLTFPVLKRQR